MATTVKVIYEHGVFKPKEPVSIPEHTEAEVLIPSAVETEEASAGWNAMRERRRRRHRSVGPD